MKEGAQVIRVGSKDSAKSVIIAHLLAWLALSDSYKENNDVEKAVIVPMWQSRKSIMDLMVATGIKTLCRDNITECIKCSFKNVR